MLQISLWLLQSVLLLVQFSVLSSAQCGLVLICVLNAPAQAMMRHIEGVLCLVLASNVASDLKEGAYSINSWEYIRLAFYQQLVTRSSHSVESTCRALPLIGSKLENHHEMVEVGFWGLPQMIRIQGDATLNDDAVLLTYTIKDGCIFLTQTTADDGAYIGNSSVVSPGARMQHCAFLGALSHLTEGTVAAEGTSWFGNPAVQMSGRRKPSKALAESEALSASEQEWLDLCGSLIELWTTHATEMCLVLLLLPLSLLLRQESILPYHVLLLAAVAQLGSCVCKLIVAWGIKSYVLGRVHPGEHHMHSSFYLRKEMSEICIRDLEGHILPDLLGSDFVVWWFRLLGAKIGSRCWIGTPWLSEPDLVSIGDGVELGAGSEVQSHLFEDGVLRLGRVTLCNNTALHCEAIAVVNSVVESYGEIYPLSIPLPGERVHGASGASTGSWLGNPLQPVQRFQAKM